MKKLIAIALVSYSVMATPAIDEVPVSPEEEAAHSDQNPPLPEKSTIRPIGNPILPAINQKDFEDIFKCWKSTERPRGKVKDLSVVDPSSIELSKDKLSFKVYRIVPQSGASSEKTQIVEEAFSLNSADPKGLLESIYARNGQVRGFGAPTTNKNPPLKFEEKNGILQLSPDSKTWPLSFSLLRHLGSGKRILDGRRVLTNMGEYETAQAVFDSFMVDHLSSPVKAGVIVPPSCATKYVDAIRGK